MLIFQAAAPEQGVAPATPGGSQAPGTPATPGGTLNADDESCSIM